MNFNKIICAHHTKGKTMKSDRQLAIINLLTEYKTLTAPMLAERFEVSRRTINRDIDELCLAGIPIVTTQGKNGNIANQWSWYSCWARHRGVFHRQWKCERNYSPKFKDCNQYS